MAYKITEDCISCGACESECPNQAISEGSSIFVINPDRCTECVGASGSPKCAEVCPVDAPKPDPAHSETKEALLAKYKKLHL
ncbi:MAG: YfhL family 4Fe-4S dicluster ferredoxin [Dehalococcoidales bacterium]|nr:YfhL family 4Fe-4S dicluster ferredoxin [Dehalococcoidales bacterium]